MTDSIPPFSVSSRRIQKNQQIVDLVFYYPEFHTSLDIALSRQNKRFSLNKQFSYPYFFRPSIKPIMTVVKIVQEEQIIQVLQIMQVMQVVQVIQVREAIL